MHLKRGKRDPWIKGEPKGGVAVRYSWDSIINTLVLSGKLTLHEGETIDRLRIDGPDGRHGVTFYIDKE